jgi:uncharacterized membrane protein YdjX (TVP38/TMEM64 family)
MFSYKAKNYALLDDAGNLIVKGGALKSRGMEPYLRDYLQEFLSLLLSGEPERAAACANLSGRIPPRTAHRSLAKTSPQDSVASRKKITASSRNRSAAFELAIKSGRNYQAGDQISYYVTGATRKVTAYENARFISDWNPHARDENVDYYVSKLDELARKFEEFASRRPVQADFLHPEAHRGTASLCGTALLLLVSPLRDGTAFLFWARTWSGSCGSGQPDFLRLVWLSAPGIAGLLLLYELGTVSQWLHDRGDAGLLVYAAVFMITSGIGLLPTTAQAVLGGWVFGPAKALVAAIVAYGGAALLGLIITRAVAGKRIEQIFETRQQARAIRDALIGRSFLPTTIMVALLRLPPQAPFAFTNFAMVSCGVATAPFLLGSILGMIPRTLVVMIFAAAAAQTGAADIQAFVKEGPGWPAPRRPRPHGRGHVSHRAIAAELWSVHVDPMAFRRRYASRIRAGRKRT